jgi:tripartite-type tricarboxylate transporter receptor subunit TctC
VADLFAHLIAQSLSERIGQRFIAENRHGAGSNVCTEAVVRASADGYTLLLASPPSTINATLYGKLAAENGSAAKGGVNDLPK